MMNDQQVTTRALSELLPDFFQAEPKKSEEAGPEVLTEAVQENPVETAPVPEEPDVSVPAQTVTPAPDPDLPVDAPDFSFDGYQVVRGEFFSHLNEPSITLCDGKISFNQTCLKKVPDTDYVLVMVNEDTQRVIVMPSTEETRDSFLWKSKTGKPRSVACAIVIAMIYSRMNWKPEYRYKMIGKFMNKNGLQFFLFDLKSAEVYVRQILDYEGKVKYKTARKPTYPADWKNQFGLTYEEHQKAIQVSVFDRYVVFSVNGKGAIKKEDKEEKDA